MSCQLKIAEIPGLNILIGDSVHALWLPSCPIAKETGFGKVRRRLVGKLKNANVVATVARC
jgi:hypothetical protein